MWDKVIEGITLVFTFKSILMMVFGSIVGVVVGAIPGLTGSMAIALVLPITLFISPWMGIPLILAIYKASTWAGSVGSILLNAPGNAAAAAMTIEGYELKRQGKGLKALKATLVSGVIGDLISDLITIAVCAPLATVALLFGPPEFLLLVILAMLVIASVGSGSVWKALIAGALGIFVAMIGVDPVMGTYRLTFGIQRLSDGIRLVPLMIGAFAMSEMIAKLLDMREMNAVKVEITPGEEKEYNNYSLREFKQNFWVILRSALIGTWIGVLPGIGSSVSPWIGYTTAKKSSKHPEEYGKGSVEGLVACQSAANAVSGANLVPLLTMGIPGDTVAAMMIGTLMVHGLTPGPLIFRNSPEAVYAIFATLLICDVIYLLVGWVTCKTAGRITMIKDSLMVPFVIVLCVVGTYAYNSSYFDVFVMFIFGVLGFVMKKTGVNVPIFVIAFILGSMFETNLRQSLVLYDGSLWGIFTRPISMIIAALLLAIIARKTFISTKRLIKSRGTAE